MSKLQQWHFSYFFSSSLALALSLIFSLRFNVYMLINGLCRFLLLSLMGMDNDYDDNYVPWQKHSPFSGSNALRVSLSLPLFINRRSYIHKSDGKWYRTVKMSDNFSTTQWYCYVFIDVHASNIQLYADFFDKHNANKSLISPRVLVWVRVCVVVWCNCMICVTIAIKIGYQCTTKLIVSHAVLPWKSHEISESRNQWVYFISKKQQQMLFKWTWKVEKIRITYSP